MPIHNLDDADSPAFRDGYKYRVAITLDIRCRVDSTHVIGKAVKYLIPFGPRLQGIVLGNGMHWDELDRAVGDCPKCPLDPRLPAATSQRISRVRLERRFAELRVAKRHAGSVQV